MRWIFVSIILFLTFGLIYTSDARRISRPDVYKLPWTEEQVNNLNNVLEDIFLMQKGRYEADIVTTPKTQANNGELWLIQTGAVVRIQYKGGEHVFTLTPDGF